MAAKKRFSIVISAIDKATGPLNKTRRKIAGIGKSMQRTGRSMSMALSLPILAFGGFTIKAAAEFEQAMNRVRGITRANAEEFKLLNDQAKLLGRTTQFTASQAAGAMEELARAGFSVEQTLEALPAVLELAASSGVELAEASKLGAGMLKGFGFEAKELTLLNDKMVTSNLSTLTTLTSLVETLKEVAPLARTMGLDFGEMAAASGLMGDTLLEGGRGGIALKQIMLKLVNATPAAQRALNDLGIKKSTLIDSEGNLRSLISVVKALEEAGAGVPDFGVIFGARVAPAVAALVNQGAAAFQLLTDEINAEAAIGEAGRQAAIRMEGATGAMLEFKSAVEGLQISIGDSGLLGSFTRVVENLTEMIQGWAEASPRGLLLATVIAGLVAVVGPLMVIIGLAATAFAAFTAPIWITIAAVIALIALAGSLIVFWKPLKGFFVDMGKAIMGTWTEVGLMFSRVWANIVSGIAAVNSAIPAWLTGALGLGFGGTAELAGAGAGGGAGTFPPPAQAEVAGQIGLKIESDVPTRVTTLETSGAVEIDVDSGPGMGGL